MKILRLVSAFALVLAPGGMDGQVRSSSTRQDSLLALMSARTTTEKVCNGSDLVCRSAPIRRAVKPRTVYHPTFSKVPEVRVTDASFGVRNLEAAEVKTLPITKVAQVVQAGQTAQASIETVRFSLCPLEPNRPICYFKAPDMNSFLDTLPRGSNVWDPQPVKGNSAFQSVKIHRQDSDKDRVYVLTRDLAKGSGRLIPSEIQPYVAPPTRIPVRKDERVTVAPKPKPVPAGVVAKKDTVIRVRVDTVHIAGKTEVRFVRDTTVLERPTVRREGMSWKPIVVGAGVITALGVAACLIWKCGSSSTSTSTSTSYSGSLTPAHPPALVRLNLKLRL